MGQAAERVVSASGRVAVLGGGVAGLAAAVALHQAGRQVILIEARNRLGGRATSFTDPATGERIDNCQHVVLGCCTNLLDFYRRLGVVEKIGWHDHMYFASEGGRIDVLKPSILPAPLHLAPSLMRFHAYSSGEKWALARCMRAIASVDRRPLINITFREWLAQHAQPERLIRRFWDVVIVSACNLPCDCVAAEPALQVFQQGFLAHRDAWRLGVPRCPLVELYDSAVRFIDDLRLGTRVVRIEGESCIERAVLDDGSTIEADAYVLAMPFEHICGVVNEAMMRRDVRLAQPAALAHSPILGVHLRFDRPLSDLPHAVLLDADVQWVFFKDRGRTAHAVISAADAWMALSAEEIIARVRADLAARFPEAAELSGNALRARHVVKEKRATFAAIPGAEAHRPPTCGPIENLFLAGDYCATGWPATMEGAARSGYAAAGAILGRNLLVPDLGPAPLYRAARWFAPQA